MKRFRLILLSTLFISSLISINTFAANGKKVKVEKVSALVMEDTKEVELDEPEIDDIVDAKQEKDGQLVDKKIDASDNKDELAGPGVIKNKESNQEEKKDEIQNVSNDRQKLLEYSMRFLGSKYKFGGNNPNTGFDCSGFTQYIYKHALGKNLLRNSTSQYTQGNERNSENMQAGDLLFYGNGKRINHVALYIGNGKVIHSSNERTGVKISPWNYRNPVGIKSILD